MPLDLARVQALCFDVDGTLSDTDDAYARQLSGWLPRGVFRDPERTARRLVMWLESPGNGLLSVADRLGIDDEMAAVINWLYRHRERPWKHFLLVPGVDDMLARLQGRFPMAVVSTRSETPTRSFLDRFDLTKYFEVLVTGQSAPHSKPYPDPVLLAAERLGVGPGNCVMIGDTTVDMRAGKSAGAQTVGVLCGFGEREELERLGADLILESTALLAEVLRP